MLLANLIESSGVLLTVVTPLITVPLTAMIFFVRSLRDQQQASCAALGRRFDSLERTVDQMHRTTSEFYRDFAGKEEWLRECMIARRAIEQLSATTVRLETQLQNALGQEKEGGPSSSSPVARSTLVDRRGEERNPSSEGSS